MQHCDALQPAEPPQHTFDLCASYNLVSFATPALQVENVSFQARVLHVIAARRTCDVVEKKRNMSGEDELVWAMHTDTAQINVLERSDCARGKSSHIAGLSCARQLDIGVTCVSQLPSA